jgi:hypothetical protein
MENQSPRLGYRGCYPTEFYTAMSSHLRFTDAWPPAELLSDYPNWILAMEEGRAGQDESTIKPDRQHQYLSDEVVYTAGNVWFPNDDSFPALIELNDYEPVGIVVYEDEHIWQLTTSEETDFLEWGSGSDVWTPSPLNSPQVSLGDPSKFPLRLISVLPESKRVGQIRRVISAKGIMTNWKYKE